MLEKTLESPLDCKEIQPVHSEGDQPWDFFGRYDAKAETPVLWTPHMKSWLIGKDSDAGRAWGQEEKGTTQGEMAGWHHGLDRRESEWTLGVGDGQGGLACCDSWGHKASDMTERLDWTELILALGNISLPVMLCIQSMDSFGHTAGRRHWQCTTTANQAWPSPPAAHQRRACSTNNNDYALLSVICIPDTVQVLYILFNLMIPIISLKVELGFYVCVTQRLCYFLSLLPTIFQDEGQIIKPLLSTSSINMYRFIICSFICSSTNNY